MRAWVVLVCLCVAACGRKSTDAPMDAGGIADDAMTEVDAAVENLPPIANAGLDAAYLAETTFTLDGTASSDPDGVITAFAWSIDAQPVGSSAVPSDVTAAMTTFTPDAVGTYTFRLLVTDDDGATAFDTVTVDVVSLTVDAGPDQSVAWPATVHLTGSYQPMTTATVKWRYVSRPATSTSVLQSASTLTPMFGADQLGTYVLELAVTVPAGTVTDTVTVTVSLPPPEVIDGNIVDVEIDPYYGKFVVASTNPNRVRTLSPILGLPIEEFEIPLSVTPTAIGVSETGEFASVLHNSTRLTQCRLPSLQQLVTIDTHTALLDVRHGTARPHAFPAQAGALMMIDYVEGDVLPGATVATAARGRMAPTPEYPLYVIELGASSKLRRYNYVTPTTPFVRDWPYTAGQYPLGNDLWIVTDSIITSAGHVFHLSEDAAVDMTHRALLAGDAGFEIVGLASGFGNIVTLNTSLSTPVTTQVRFYDYLTLALEQVVVLPDLVVGGVAQPTRGLSVTQTSAGTTHVFVMATAGTTTAVFTVPRP